MLHRRIRDSRNTLRRVPPPDWDHGAPSESPAARAVNQIRAAIYGVPSGLGLRLLGGALLGAAAGVVLFYAVRFFLDAADAARSAPVLVGLVGLAAAYGWFRLGVGEPRYRQASDQITRHRVCICCAYDLSSLRPDPDGCTICPECGAAWRLAPPDPPAAPPA